MKPVDIIKDNNRVIIKLSGKVDSLFTDAHQNEIYSSFSPTDHVVIDLEDVEYVSSAGLRIVLKCAKTSKEFEVINANPSVYEVFSISGLAEMLKISRAKRVLSCADKEIIGRGANGTVYRYDIDTIVKVYKSEVLMSDIENEILMSKKAFMGGVPTAIPFDIVKIAEGGYGTVYELLKSDVMSNLIIKNPEKKGKYTELFADALNSFLHSKIDDPTMPQKTEFALSWTKFYKENNIFSDEEIDKIISLIKSIDCKPVLVHGDFHIKNVMFQGEDPIIIDMDTLGVGHPLYEVAYSYYAMVLFDEEEPQNAVDFFGLDYDTVAQIYYDAFDILFKNKSEEERKDIQGKASLLAHLRVTFRESHRATGNKSRAKHAIEYVKEHINDYDTLDCDI